MDNPVVQRLDILRERWEAFRSDSEAPALLWVCDEPEWRMVEAFLELENSDTGLIPDLFLDLRAPFVEGGCHGSRLRRQLVERFEEGREDLEAEEVDASWVPPSGDSLDSDTGAFLQACGSLRRHYDEILNHLVLVLIPDEVADGAEWRNWVRGLVQRHVPEGVRFILLDSVAEPFLNGLPDEQPQGIESEAVDLDMPLAYQELTWGGDPGVPGVLFRRQFVAMASATGAGDLEGARESARTCMAIATGHDWAAQAAVTQMTLAGALLSHNRPDEAIEAYREAQSFAALMIREEEEAGVKVLAQARMAEAAAHLSKQDPHEAARLYHETARLEGIVDDPFLHLESWRMAAACYQQCGDIEQAWTCGWAALEAGAALDPEGRAASSLPWAGAALRSLCGEPWHENQRQAVDARMEVLLGPEWMPDLEAGP